MLETLTQLGYISPRNDHGSVSSLGSYINVPSITVYGNPVGSANMTGTNDAKLEQYPSRNIYRAGA